jgi:hypothetical protein
MLNLDKIITKIMVDEKTIEISWAHARDLLELYENRLLGLSEERDRVNYEYERIEKGIAELKAKLNGAQQLPGLGVAKLRRKKGEGEKAIFALLGALTTTSKGLSLSDISKRTNVAYSSVFRLLKKKGNGKFIEDKGLWKIRS